MDMSDKDKFELEKRNDNPLDYLSPDMSSDWRFGGISLANAPMNLVSTGNPMAVISSSCSSAPTVDSFGQTIWDNPTKSQNLGVFDIDFRNNISSLNTLGVRSGSSSSLRTSIDRPCDMGWNPASSMLKGGVFLPNATGMFLQSLSPFPERAPSFSGGNFSDMINTFGVPEMACLNYRGWGMMQGSQDFVSGSGLKSVSGTWSQKKEMNVAELSKDVSMSVEHGATDGSTLKKDRKGVSLVKSHEEEKQGVGGSGDDSDEAEFSGGSGNDDPSALQGTGRLPSFKSHSSKRKRNGLDMELDQGKGSHLPGEAAKDNTENEQKGDQTPISTTIMTSGKHGKQGSQTSDPPKEEYIHVRARRGQATNSHSLAERVRREKISERMKFLQDLVPGCSKVTGKAVMLDEIINYVQSLQQQVEFLSMKLSTVNPHLDFNMEGLLEKVAGPSSTLGFSPDMPLAYLPLHPSQPGLIHAALPGMGSPSDILRRTINSQMTQSTGRLKESTQEPTILEDELYNVAQMSRGTSGSP